MDKHTFMRACREGGDAIEQALRALDRSFHATLVRLASRDFHGIELLTLSACQTGLGGATLEDGREVEGLPALVQRRGARRVVATLWQVEDQSTARLMQEMYRALRPSGGDVAAALRTAQRAVRARSRTAHPYYWAGFVVSAGP